MRINLTLVDPQCDARHDVVLEAEDASPTGEALDAFGTQLRASVSESHVVSLNTHRASGRGPNALAYYLRGEPLDRARPIAESGLKEGSLVSVGDPAFSEVAEPLGNVDLRVVTGPGAGDVHRLTTGDATIGSDPGCVVVLDDPRLPPMCAVLTVRHDGTVQVHAVDDAASVIGETVPHADPPLALEREPLGKDPVDWPVGALLTVGDIRLERAAVSPPDAAVEDSPEAGWVDYNRPPRLLPPERKTDFRLPTRPKDTGSHGLPWLVMLFPLLLAVTMATVMKQPTYLMMGLFSPMMMLGNHIQNRRQGKKSFREQVAEFEDLTRRIEADIEEAVVAERVGRRMEAPDPALALTIATGPRRRLWERRTTDPDYLKIRIGIGDLVSDVTVEDPEQLEHKRQTRRLAYDVPVTISLRERGVIGIATGDGLQRRLGAWAAAQLAVLQSPRDTQLYVLTDAANAYEWEWVRWLPHARPQSGQDTAVTIGTDTETCARRIAELTAMIAARQAAKGEADSKVVFPDIVVIMDGARRLRTLPGVVAILKQGPALGIHTICLDVEERLLPEEATAVVLGSADGLTLEQMHVTLVDRVTPDLVGGPWLQRTARALAPIRDISGNDGDSVLPAACRLTEVMGLEPLGPEVIKARWATSPRSTEAMVGISLDGPFAIDMRRDGPHGLVAGTTGAGKSELLQSIVASLAVANRPDGMTFVLVDYKGGAAFKDCEDLPHTVGMVTDLDTHLVERALVSLGAELTRREHMLAAADAKDIEDYVDIAAKRGGLEDMPRLLIVIDEFASMARELPDFITGLVNVAQRGRSLGIHLILATQRPGGVVSPEIRANTNLRIALRVTDAGESSDVIDSPEAGHISKSTPGRAYVRLGAQSLVPFQSGRVGGRRPGAVAAPTAPAWLDELPLAMLAKPAPTRPRVETVDDAEITDLKVLVSSIREANDQLGLPPQHSPWLPALTTSVLLDELIDDLPEPADGEIAAIPYAAEDIPAQQARRPALIEFAEFSHLAIMGGPRSGRSQALRTISGAIARLTSPADVHVFGLDCGNGALLPIADLPHCGAIVPRTQEDRAVRLIARLMSELSRRQELLASGGYASLTELRAAVDPAERPAHLVFLLDSWEGFMGTLAEQDGGSPFERVQTLLREGASAGIHLIITGDKQVIGGRMASLVEHKIGMRIPDRSDFALMGLNPKKLPEDIPAGRGFRSESGIELQFALLSADVDGPAQAATLRQWGAEASAQHADVPRDRRPFRVDVLPGRIGFEEAWTLLDEPARPLWALCGVGGDELAADGFDLSETNVAVVAGPPKSGRSTTLIAIAESLLRGGAELVIAAPRKSPLRGFEGRPGVRAVLTEPELETDRLTELMAPGTPVVLIVDDGELLKEVEARDFLRTVIRTGADHGQAIVLGGDSDEVASGFSGWQVDMKGRQGVLISPQGITEGDLIGVRIPRGGTGTPPPGRVVLNRGDGVLRMVQVPLPPQS